MLERNALLESGQTSRKRIDELEKCLSKNKALVAQLKLKLNAAKEELARAQSQVQELSNSLDQLNPQIPSMKASVIEEFKASMYFENILDEEFLKGGAKVKAMIDSRYPQFDYRFLEDWWRLLLIVSKMLPLLLSL